MSDTVEGYRFLIALYAINGAVWVGSALSAYMGYRAFRQRVDINWAIAFLLMAAVLFGEAFVAYRWSESLLLAEPPVRAAAVLPLYYQLRIAALALAPSFLVFYLFRNRRRSF